MSLKMETGEIMDIEEMKKELERELGPKLYLHSLGTMEEAERLASFYGCDIKKARIASWPET
jgi:HD superfamily phosphohydrolase YqeK